MALRSRTKWNDPAATIKSGCAFCASARASLEIGEYHKCLRCEAPPIICYFDNPARASIVSFLANNTTCLTVGYAKKRYPAMYAIIMQALDELCLDGKISLETEEEARKLLEDADNDR